MTAATSGNFIDQDQSTLSPFGAQAAPLTLAEQSKLEDMRRERIRQDAIRTNNVNQAPGGYLDQRSEESRSGLISPEENAARLKDKQRGFLGNLVRDPITAGILLAPYGVLGAGAALGGLAAGGTGTLVGGASGVGGAGAGTGLGAGGQAAALAGSQAGGPAAALAAQNAANGVIVGGGAAGASGGAGAALGSAAGSAAGAAAGSSPSWLPYALGPASGLAQYGIDRAMGGTTNEEKALVQKQQQMAEETQRRREQVQQQSMDALGQQLLAFAPMNQAMAQMYGPDAAFSQEQFAQMAANPMHPDVDPALMNYTGTDPEMIARGEDAARRIQQYDQSEQARRGMIMGGIPAPGPGPAPVSMPAPQAARRY